MAYKRFESGVSRYIEGFAVVSNLFPVDWRGNADICCRACDFYKSVSRTCALTKKVSEYPEKYVGSACPLQYDDGTEPENINLQGDNDESI